jgi:hypothetical protein
MTSSNTLEPSFTTRTDTHEGVILRNGPNMLIFNDYEALEQILTPCRRQREPHTKSGHRERPAQGQHEAQNSIGLVE